MHQQKEEMNFPLQGLRITGASTPTPNGKFLAEQNSSMNEWRDSQVCAKYS